MLIGLKGACTKMTTNLRNLQKFRKKNRGRKTNVVGYHSNYYRIDKPKLTGAPNKITSEKFEEHTPARHVVAGPGSSC